MELSTADPVPTSVRFYLAALLSNSAGREICRCFIFFFFSPTNRCIKLSRAKQQTDGSVRCMKRKMFCSGPSCAFGRGVFFSKVLEQSGCFAFFGKTAHPLCFAFTVELSHLRNPWERRKNFSDLWRFAQLKYTNILAENTLQHACFGSTGPPTEMTKRVVNTYN